MQTIDRPIDLQASHTREHISSHSRTYFSDYSHDQAKRKYKQNSISTTPNHPTIENIKTAIKENDFANAYTMFKEVEQKSPALLASLPPYHFSKIIDIVVREKHKSIGGELVNRLHRASDILELMRKLQVRPNYAILLTALYIYGRMQDFSAVNSVFAEIQQREFSDMNRMTLARMCQACILCGQESRGQEYFSQLLHIDRSTRSYNLLIISYSLNNDEMGMLRSLERMLNDRFTPDASSISALCRLYRHRGDPGTVHNHLRVFKDNGGVLTLGMYVILMQMANSLGNYKDVIKYHKEMQAKGIETTSSVLSEILIACAYLDDVNAMWSAYKDYVASGLNLTKAMRFALCQSIGSLATDSSGLSEVIVVAATRNIDLRHMYEQLVRGYVLLGDAESVKVILRQMKVGVKRLRLKEYAHVVWAYVNAGDAESALAYVLDIERRNHSQSPELWFAVLVAVVQFSPESVKKIVDHIQNNFPNVSMDEMWDRVKKQIKGSRELRSGFDEYI
ncbi:Pentatricopeptide repeat-containing protein 1, mitochondrial [Batrachochytrium dendrobatidis]